MKNPEISLEFVLNVRNRISCRTTETATVENDHWNDIKQAYNTTSKKVLGYRKKNNKPWISMDSWKEIVDGRTLKKFNDAKSDKD